MKKFLILLLVALAAKASAQSTATAIFSTSGIAPIPSFTKEGPAALLFASIPVGKHVTIDPDFTFSLKEKKPWFSDVWVHYFFALDTGKKWIATLGADPSLFFQMHGTGKKAYLQTVGYPTVEGKLAFSPNAHSTFTLDYQYLFAIPKADGSKGSYASLAYRGTLEGKYFLFAANPNFFYLIFSDGTKGFDSSIDISCLHKKTGLVIGLQIVQPVTVKASFAKGLYIGYTKTF